MTGEGLVSDIWKIGFQNKRIIISRKHTRNLFDLTSLWKKTVLTTLDNDVLELEENICNIHHHDSDSDMDIDGPEYLFNVVGYRQLM
jgi:hypothetical protein